MFEIGSFIIYGDSGVCKISDIKSLDLANLKKEKLYYIINPVFHNSTIYCPVDNTKVFMRPIISKEEAEQLIEMIPTLKVEAYHDKVLRNLSEHYKSILKSHDCQQILELTMSIYSKKQSLQNENQKIGLTDERFMKSAEEYLFGELSVALDIPRDEIQQYIEKKVNSIT